MQSWVLLPRSWEHYCCWPSDTALPSRSLLPWGFGTANWLSSWYQPTRRRPVILYQLPSRILLQEFTGSRSCRLSSIPLLPWRLVWTLLPSRGFLYKLDLRYYVSLSNTLSLINLLPWDYQLILLLATKGSPWYVQPCLCNWAYKRCRATYQKDKGMAPQWLVSS